MVLGELACDGAPFELVNCLLGEILSASDVILEWIDILLEASQRGGQNKARAVFSAIKAFLRKLAVDFDLKRNIDGYLIEKRRFDKMTFLVSDLRKFKPYARSIGFKDNKRFKPQKRITFIVPRGWINEYSLLVLKAVFPNELAKEFRSKDCIIDLQRPMPRELRTKISNGALYWRIKKFRQQFSEPMRTQIPQPPAQRPPVPS